MADRLNEIVMTYSATKYFDCKINLWYINLCVNFILYFSLMVISHIFRFLFYIMKKWRLLEAFCSTGKSLPLNALAGRPAFACLGRQVSKLLVSLLHFFDKACFTFITINQYLLICC